ncbi:PhnA domain-containing protein [Patiriisocius hiemis]|uniref:PhnA domain-containing protein n=1 Tax=Patiriisocius hiemis TaxID=3075604 RepID=A0ABU2YEN6_9FLAO|nr:PhnA domain-containing protein [Constantimarinum sp. W242]MDT0556331.1 PhnA domain-containing protein [Constantimarinum sp. W242]
MSLEREVSKRANNVCEFCSSEEKLGVYEIPNSPTYKEKVETSLWLCSICRSQLEDADTRDVNHWRLLNDSIWSPVSGVKVLSWRMLHRLKAEGWPQDLLDMMYLDEEEKEWAAASGDAEDKSKQLVHRDSNGNILQSGDSVVLIKDLKVKGSSMIAKQGTAVRRISLDHENETYIEGKVDGQQIVIITDYVKKI